MQGSLPPINITQAAVGDHVKGIAEELDVSLTTVYRMLSDDGYDCYGRFLALHAAVFKRNPAGANLLFEDFRARHEAMTSGEMIQGSTKEDAVVDVLDVLAAFVKDGEDFEVKANTAIRAIRFLLVQRKA